MNADRQTRKTGKTRTKSPVKTVLIFVGFMLCCIAAGTAFGVLIAKTGLDGLDTARLRAALTPFITYGSPLLLIAIWVIAGIFCLMRYVRARRDFSRWDGEDERVISAAERELSRCMIVSNIAFILELFLFAAWASFTLRLDEIGWSFPVMMAAFFLGLAAAVVIQRSVVELEKKINPEKRGDVLDLHFKKEWEQSFDEAERIMAGQAAYKAFKAVNTACIALWLLCTLGDMIFRTGLLAVAAVTALWLISTLVYQAESFRLEHGK